MGLRLRTVPARRGLHWVQQALKLFARRPLGLTALLVLFLAALLLVAMLPWAGGVLALAALPLLSLGFMRATRAALAGKPSHIGHFVEPLKPASPRRAALLRLCLLYGAAMTLVLLLSEQVDGGRFDQVRELLGRDGEPDRQAVEALLADGRIQAAMLLRMGLTALLAIPFWHAPALLHWGGQGVGQALFSSTLACWRNAGAFVVYLLGFAALVLAYGALSSLLLSLLGLGSLLGFVAMGGGLALSTVFYVSLYFSFADCFGDDESVTAA